MWPSVLFIIIYSTVWPILVVGVKYWPVIYKCIISNVTQMYMQYIAPSALILGFNIVLISHQPNQLLLVFESLTKSISIKVVSTVFKGLHPC